MPATIKTLANKLGNRKSPNKAEAFRVALRACVGNDAPLRQIPFPIKLEIIYRVPETDIYQFIQHADKFKIVCRNIRLTEDCTSVHKLVQMRLIKQEIQESAARLLQSGKS